MTERLSAKSTLNKECQVNCEETCNHIIEKLEETCTRRLDLLVAKETELHNLRSRFRKELDALKERVLKTDVSDAQCIQLLDDINRMIIDSTL